MIFSFSLYFWGGKIANINREKIAKGVSQVLDGIGKPDNNTPKRVADFYEAFFSRREPKDILSSFFKTTHHEMITVKNIPFYSLCEHHMLPFFGTCHFAYVPDNKRIVGLSSITELVDSLSRQFLTQEALTTQIAEEFMKHVKPKGMGIILKARHLCMEMRGKQKHGAVVITSAVRGLVKEDPKTREEFLLLTRD